MHFLKNEFRKIQAENKPDEQLSFINNSSENIYGGKAMGFKFFLSNKIARNYLHLSLFIKLASLRTTEIQIIMSKLTNKIPLGVKGILENPFNYERQSAK